MREQLEAVTGERIVALEAVGEDKAKAREVGMDAGRSPGLESDASESRERAMEQSRAPKGLDRDLGL